jgi:hypothetical protein
MAGGAHAEGGIDAVVRTPEGDVSLRSALRARTTSRTSSRPSARSARWRFPWARAAEALADARGAPGRLERVRRQTGGALRRAGGLRPHARRAGAGARDAAHDHEGAGDLRVRLRRRPRPREAPAHGGGGGAGARRRGAHHRQPAQRGPRAIAADAVPGCARPCARATRRRGRGSSRWSSTAPTASPRRWRSRRGRRGADRGQGPRDLPGVHGVRRPSTTARSQPARSSMLASGPETGEG